MMATSTPKLSKRQRLDREKEYRNQITTAICAFCGEEFELPRYRVWMARYRENLLFDCPECRFSVQQMEAGLPPGDDCLANVKDGCDSPRAKGRKGLCEAHYWQMQRNGAVRYKKKKPPSYWKKQAQALRRHYTKFLRDSEV